MGGYATLEVGILYEILIANRTLKSLWFVDRENSDAAPPITPTFGDHRINVDFADVSGRQGLRTYGALVTRDTQSVNDLLSTRASLLLCLVRTQSTPCGKNSRTDTTILFL